MTGNDVFSMIRKGRRKGKKNEGNIRAGGINKA